MNDLQIESTDRLIYYHGIEDVINFYLDCMLESEFNHEYWISSLRYLSTKIIDE